MVQISDELKRYSELPVPVSRVLSPKQCSNIKFEKSKRGDVEILSIVPSSSFPFKLASQTKAHRVGVVFAANSCCASGVNNSLSGLYSYLSESGRIFEMFGFVGGPHAMTPVSNAIIKIESLEMLTQYNNLGGTELLGYSSFKKIDLGTVQTCCEKLGLTALAIVAASDELPSSVKLSNMLKNIGIVATIIPQSRNQHVYIPNGICSTSLGFDSARRILSEFAGSIAVDCISSKKYWHFINCGDAALAAEVSLLIRANITVTESDPSVGIKDWVERVSDMIENRVEHGMRSGVVMVSQCAFSRTKEMETLRNGLKGIAETTFPVPEHVARRQLSKESFALLDKLPKEIKQDLLRQKDDDGNPRLSYWSPEEYLVDLVKAELKQRNNLKVELAFRAHFLAHESRCPVPTPFDCVFGSSLGRTAAAFIVQNLSGYMVSIRNLHSPLNEWIPCGIEISSPDSLLIQQQGYSLTKPVDDTLKNLESEWALQSRYRSFGPLQLSRSSIEIDSSSLPLTVLSEIADITSYLNGGGGNDLYCGQDRKLMSFNPPITLPIRSISDMSPLEQSQRQYEPKVPGYLSEPFVCIDSDICARVCSDSDLMKSVFPNSEKILPVEIVNRTNPSLVHFSANVITPGTSGFPQIKTHPTWRMSFDEDGSVVSDSSSSDDECQVSVAPSSPNSPCKVEARVRLPNFQRFLTQTLPSLDSQGRLMSPRNSLRSLPPEHTQLVRTNEMVWADPRGLRQVSTDTSLTRRPQSEGLKLGVVFLCSQVPGCHNVVSGLFDYLAGCSPAGELVGILGGATGLKLNWYHTLTCDMVDRYRNQGGQDLLGHFGESLVTESDYLSAIETIRNLDLDGLVVVGNLEGQLAAALLTERLIAQNICTRIISVPCSAENEIPFIRQSIGCDTVTRIFSNAIANLWTECHSSKHRWYFVRLMSHHVSHLALECALATHPNIILVTEEVAARKQSLVAITEMISDCICERSVQGKEFGIVLIPDGVVAAIPEIRQLLRELDQITSKQQSNTNQMNMAMRLELIQAQLSRFSSVIFKQLPRFVQTHLLNGMRHSETSRIDIANVAMERILQSLVSVELEKRRRNNRFNGHLSLLVHSLAHQGRSSLPTAFDCDLAYTCGYTSGILIDSGRTGLVTNVEYIVNRETGEDTWTVGGLPLSAMCGLKRDKDSSVQVFIEPTRLVMSGSGCRALLDSMPAPHKRDGCHPGPYQYHLSVSSWELSLGNLDTWSAFESIKNDCREILSVVGMETGKENNVIESVVKSLENIVTTLNQSEEFKYGDWFLNEPDDILSTCKPSRVFYHE